MSAPSIESVQKKSLFRQALRWVGWTALVLLVALLTTVSATFAYYRLRGPTAEQRDALALMRQDYRPAHGVNAFPFLLYLNYDVPDDRLDAQLAADAGKLRKQFDVNNPPFLKSYTDVPELPALSEAEKAVRCNPKGTDCLAQVAAHPDAVRVALAAHPKMLARMQAVEQADFFWNDFPVFQNPVAPLAFDNVNSGENLRLSALALQYVQGDRLGALAGTWRLGGV